MDEVLSFLYHHGIHSDHHIILHGSYRGIRNALINTKAEEFLQAFLNYLTPEGSLVLPAFSYCFRRKNGRQDAYDPANTPSKTGYLSEVYRSLPGIIRTASPTHSFAICGKITEAINESNSPASPLGAGSVMEWFAKTSGTYHFLAATNFSSLSFCHYMEIIFNVPWAAFSPWEYAGVLPFGVSISGIQPLLEIPGCSKAFISFQDFLLNTEIMKPIFYKDIASFYISTSDLLTYGQGFFHTDYRKLLCGYKTCEACDIRRLKYNIF